MFLQGTLGVPTLEYLPYTFLAYLTPIVAIIYAVTDKFIWRVEPTEVTVDSTISQAGR